MKAVADKDVSRQWSAHVDEQQNDDQSDHRHDDGRMTMTTATTTATTTTMTVTTTDFTANVGVDPTFNAVI
jgi:hypothetical protein